MAVAGLPKLNDIKNAVTKAKEALSKYNSGKGSLKSLEDGISNLKSIQNDEYNKLKNLKADHENKKYLNVDSYNSAKDNYNKAVENYQKLYDYLKSGDVKNDNADYKTAKNKYDSVYAIINSNRWYEESDAYKAALEKAGQANQKHNTARDWFDNNDYLKQNSGYQGLVNDYKNAQEAFNKARDFASGDNYLRDNSDYNNRTNTFNDATKKLQDLNNWKSSEQYLKDNGGYQNAVNAANDRQNDLRNAESKLDNWDGNRSGSSWDSAVRNKTNAENAYQTARNAIDTARSNADKEANKKIQDQENTRNTAENELNRVKGEAERNANTARENAEKNYNTLREKEENTRNQLHDAAQNAVDTTKELRDSTKSEAERAKDVARDVAQKAADDAKTAMDAAENRAVEAAYPKLVAAQKTIDANGTTLGSLADALSTAAYKDVEAQDKVVSQKDGLLQTAEKKYGDAVAAIEPDLQTYNAYASDVVGYAKQFRENLPDISKPEDVIATKELYDNFNKLVGAGDFTDEVKNKITPYFNGIEFTGDFNKATEIKTPETPTAAQAKALAIKGANPGYFSNIDPDTGLPILDQKALDAVLAKYGGGSLNAGEYRDNYDKFGWNVKSDGSSVKQGAAIWGIEKQVNPMGGYVWYTGDMKSVANQLGVDISGLKNQDQIFNAINEKVGDYYLVSNALDRDNVKADKQTPHASILFKSDGSGNLLPVTDETGNVVQNNYNSIVVHHGGASEQFAELAPLLSMAALVFAPQLGGMLNSAIGGIQVSAAVAPTAFTMGLPAVTLAQTIGATGVSMLSGAIQNVITSGLTGGDIGKAALSGALGPAISGNAAQMLDRVGIDQSKIEAIASATNTSAQQVTNMLSNALTVGVTGVVLGNPNALEDAATGLAGQYVGTQAQNLVYDAMKGADPKIIATTVNAAGNVSNIATQTLINGGDVTAALQNAMPSIITGAAKAGEAVGKSDGPGTATIEERSTYPEPTLDPSDVAKPDTTLGKSDVTQPDQTAAFDTKQTAAFDTKQTTALTAKDLPGFVDQVFPEDLGKSLEHGETVADSTEYGTENNSILDVLTPKYNSLINFSDKTDPNAPYGNGATSVIGGSDISSIGNGQKSGSFFELFAETSNGRPVFKIDGTGPTFTLFVVDGVPQLKKDDGTVTYITLEDKKTLEDQAVKVKDAVKANNAEMRIIDDNSNKVVKEPPKVDIKLSDIVDPNKKPVESKPAEAKTTTTTTAGGSATAAPSPAPSAASTSTPQQKVDELEKLADAAKTDVLNAASNFIQNPTPENKAKVDAAELISQAAKNASDAAKLNLPAGPSVSYTPAPTPAPAPSGGQSGNLEVKVSGSGASNQPSGAPPGTQQPSSQPPSQPGSQTPSPPGSQTSQTPTTPGSGSSNLPGDSLSTIPGPGGTGTQGTATSGTGTNANGTGTGGTGAGGTGTGGTGTGGTGTGGSGTGTGAGVGSGIDGILAALAGLGGSGKVSTGALAQVPQGYVATTTPLAKRPIGDLFPVSFTMMTPEEIAARSSTKIVRRGGLVSIRK